MLTNEEIKIIKNALEDCVDVLDSHAQYDSDEPSAESESRDAASEALEVIKKHTGK